jgi:2-polyprenyl-3-methyl-5-hydroxy-6-metoxy-1,4-benzoquinol methylase
MRQQFRYFLSSLAKSLCGVGLACPSCGSASSQFIQRKYVATTLRRCEQCRLMYRAPTTSDRESRDYYQEDYESGFTTELPNEPTLAKLLECGFKRTPKDFTRYISILRALGGRPGLRVFDFGSSWGYGAWQFRRAGFNPVGYEVSSKRAAFASERLGVPVTCNLSSVTGPFEVFFSAHVLEHVPNVEQTIKFGMDRLHSRGFFVAITPNGSLDRKKTDPSRWTRAWGLKHPNLLDEEFYRSLWGTRDLFLTTDLADLSAVTSWAKGQGSATGPLDGGELLAIGRK